MPPCAARPATVPSATRSYPNRPPILFGTNIAQAFTVRCLAPSPLMGEGKGGGAHRRRRDHRPLLHPAMGEGEKCLHSQSSAEHYCPSPAKGKGHMLRAQVAYRIVLTLPRRGGRFGGGEPVRDCDALS